MKLLVTGGAGYIGSITVRKLQSLGHEVVVFDNLAHGHKESVDCRLIVGDLLDKEFLYKNLKNDYFDGVIHFAAYALAGESMEKPFKYFQNNIMGGLNLLEFMRDQKINNIIFSSTCAIYGTPEVLPVSEAAKKNPESAYGESKLMFEKILDWYDKIYGIKYINLRYFNAAGASLDGKLGEDHNPETHIIPVAIKAAMAGNSFYLFGDDYDTSDGTCIRDYIHVEDLATAHALALEKLIKTRKSDSFNLGVGKGYSNREVLNMIKRVSKTDFPIVIRSRRYGDPPKIFADNDKAKKELNFNPRYSDLETIVRSAWDWHFKKSKIKNQKSK
ncbi:MAG: UDP-glucose 4-epimerase GalE [Candidatus Levybacteria bacterium]|nr:UDP-glucose 4-epimerase GalE [Candidatus Levybacteria bacterium]